jgi:hypothetical protein
MIKSRAPASIEPSTPQIEEKTEAEFEEETEAEIEEETEVIEDVGTDMSVQPDDGGTTVENDAVNEELGVSVQALVEDNEFIEESPDELMTGNDLALPEVETEKTEDETSGVMVEPASSKEEDQMDDFGDDWD